MEHADWCRSVRSRKMDGCVFFSIHQQVTREGWLRLKLADGADGNWLKQIIIKS